MYRRYSQFQSQFISLTFSVSCYREIQSSISMNLPLLRAPFPSVSICLCVLCLKIFYSFFFFCKSFCSINVVRFKIHPPGACLFSEKKILKEKSKVLQPILSKEMYVKNSGNNPNFRAKRVQPPQKF